MLLLAFADAAAAADLVSHRATYEMRLNPGRRAMGVIDVRGLMVMESVDVCDAWETKQRIRLTFLRPDTEEFVTDSAFTSFEAKDGSSMQFSVRNTQNGEVEEELRGQAEVGPGAGRANFTLPEPRSFDLPAGTVFPMAHLSQLIEHAKLGEKVVAYNVFDGARLDGAFKVNAVIGKAQRPPPGAAPKGDVGLMRNQPAWMVRLAFFPADDQAGQPEYEVSMDLLGNGIARSMVLDYGDFALDAKLQRLEALPKPKC
ncbi:EipB family protein [Vineibacter terrae]|uniref:EipB family protein n=1 Tax=Vineibacter terrae TaxID=2586908 RepID=UPI002E31661B|nr:DUF1849 family protein [Vineibacter terrae]HEX2892090.1 DUF1849 family protein [Vineibacter terrae]